MLEVTGFNEYNIKLDGVIGNDAGHTKIVDLTEKSGNPWTIMHEVIVDYKLVNTKLMGGGFLHLVCDGTANLIEVEKRRIAILGGCIIIVWEEKEGAGSCIRAKRS